LGGGIVFKDNKWARVGTSVLASAVGSGLSPTAIMKEGTKNIVGTTAGQFTWAWSQAGFGAAKGLAINGGLEVFKKYVKIESPSLTASIGSLITMPLGIAGGVKSS